MKAAVLEEFGKPLVVQEIPVPTPGPGEVLVQVKGSGLCATDLHIRDGNIPTVRVRMVCSPSASSTASPGFLP